MDDTERDRNRTPNWVGKPPPASTSRRPIVLYAAPSEPTSWLLNLVLVVVLCVVIMAIATAALRQWRPSPVATPLVVIAQNPQREAARSERTALDELEKQARVKAAQEAEQRRDAAIKARLAEEEAARRIVARETRRQTEWLAYYKKPAYCDELLPDVDSVGCANDYIRQRRTFDTQFNVGRR